VSIMHSLKRQQLCETRTVTLVVSQPYGSEIIPVAFLTRVC